MNKDGELRIVNRTALPARLRFRCDGRPAWDAWIAPGGEAIVPEPRSDRLTCSARYDDPETRVAFVLPAGPVFPGYCLAAGMHHVAQAAQFVCAMEPGSAPHAVGIANRTGGDVGFTLRFLGSPFAVQLPVRAGDRAQFRPQEFDLVVTLAGVTSAAWRIRDWRGALEVHATKSNGLELPSLVQAAQ
ncbi:MAG TPA: hypothetical protein VEC06_10990 [Paucimonas sp.]|nr:hypothetical protein [Paucimonas sp.]